MDDYGLLGLEELIIKRQGKVWKFKHEDGKIKMKISYDSGGEEDWQEIGSDFYGGFSFALDYQNEINLIYKNGQEQVRYFAYTLQGLEELYNLAFPKGERITFQKLLAPEPKKQLILLVTEDVENQGWKIYSCAQNDGTWEEPLVVDSGWGFGPEQVALAIGKEGQIYLAYQRKNQDEYNMVYRIYKNNNWSEVFPVVSSKEFNFSPCLAIDGQGKPHLVWLRAINSEIRLMYTCKVRVNNFWTRWQWQKEQIISPPGVSCISPAIVLGNGSPEIYWQVSEGTYTKIYRSVLGEKEEAQLVSTLNFQRSFPTVLDLDKISKLNNYSDIGPGTTLFFLLLAEENYRQLTQRDILPQGEKVSSKDLDLKKELLKEKEKVESLARQNAKLQDDLLKKNQEFINVRSNWEKKEKELKKEIERLRQSLQAIQEINEELRQKLKERKIQEGKGEKEGQVKPPGDVRKVYPHFPFLKRKL